jgi:hypothetical protein
MHKCFIFAFLHFLSNNFVRGVKYCIFRGICRLVGLLVLMRARNNLWGGIGNTRAGEKYSALPSLQIPFLHQEYYL